MKSPLRYPGGKSREAKNLFPLFPDFKEYREPFVGGGSVFFYTKERLRHKRYWINDIYEPLYCLYWAMSSNPEYVTSKVREIKSSLFTGKEIHDSLKRRMSLFSDRDKAVAFFILNRITFSGTSESGGYSKQAFQGRFTDSSIERLSKVHKELVETKITNMDFSDVIHPDGTNVFVFLDPPYFSAENSSLYGKSGDLHRGFDHLRLSKTLKETSHKWLMTYDDSEYIRELYSFADIKEKSVVYGMKNVSSSNQKKQEIIIKNY